MKKVLYSVAIATSVLLTACGGENQKKTEEKTEVVNEKQFACPMKCEGDKTYAKEGECPKCHMDLVEVK